MASGPARSSATIRAGGRRWRKIGAANFSVSRYSLPTEVPEGHGQAQIRVRRASGKSFALAAPRDINGADPDLKAKLEEIRAYWAKAQGQIQTSGN